MTGDAIAHGTTLLCQPDVPVDVNTCVGYFSFMNAREFRRWLSKQGCTFENHQGGSGHLTIRLGSRTSQLPMHGARRELGRKLVAKIKKDLGLN